MRSGSLPLKARSLGPTGSASASWQAGPHGAVCIVRDGEASGEDGAMKRSTAIGHLVEMAEVATERMRLRRTDIGWPLEELWASGELLGLADTVEAGSVALVLDLPADELPWLALHPTGEWVGEQLRLGKRPIQWCYRPLTRPVWNHEHRRLVRFWTAASGLDADVIEALRSRRLDRVVVVEPSAQELVVQLREELAPSRRRLRSVLDGYWEHDWRREHKGYDESPENHLWRAATAVEGHARRARRAGRGGLTGIRKLARRPGDAGFLDRGAPAIDPGAPGHIVERRASTGSSAARAASPTAGV